MKIVKSSKNSELNNAGVKVQYKVLHLKVELNAIETNIRVIEPKKRRTLWELNPYHQFKMQLICDFSITPFTPSEFGYFTVPNYLPLKDIKAISKKLKKEGFIIPFYKKDGEEGVRRLLSGLENDLLECKDVLPNKHKKRPRFKYIPRRYDKIHGHMEMGDRI